MWSIPRFIERNSAMIALAGVMHAGALFANLIWPMYFDLRVFYLYTGLWTVAFILWVIRRFSIGKLVAYVLLVASIFFLYTDIHDPRAPFLRHLRSIKPGMTVSQVESIMKPHQLWYKSKPKANGEVYYTHRGLTGQLEHWYGGDIGTVEFRNGKVVRVGFHPD